MTLLWTEATSFGRGRDIFFGKKITSVLLYLRRDLMHITFAYSVFIQYESSTYKCSLGSMLLSVLKEDL
jgi:hypothetical protein